MKIRPCENCGKQIKVSPSNEHIRRFCSFVCRKSIYTPEMRIKMSQIKKEQYKKGLKPWNTGIPYKSNNALEEYRLKNNGNFGANHPQWKGGLNPMWVRKERLRRNGGSHTEQEWEELKAKCNNICPSCNQFRQLTKDHIIPISKGGTDDITNIQPLCRSCNSQKHKQEIKFEY